MFTMECRALLVTALAACLLAHVVAQPQLPSTVTNYVITPEQPVARRPWTVQFEYTPSGQFHPSTCNRLTAVITHTDPNQLKACTPAKSYSRVSSGGKTCLMTVHCGKGGDTVGGLQSLQATIQARPRGNRPAQALETFSIANAPYANSLCMLPSGPWLDSCTGCTYSCGSQRTAACSACPCSGNPSSSCPVSSSQRATGCDVSPPPPMVLTYNKAAGSIQRVCPAAR